MSFERFYCTESHEKIKQILIFGDKSLLLTCWVTYVFLFLNLFFCFEVCLSVFKHVVACRLPETSILLTYLILDRKGLVSGSDFPYLSVCRRSVAPCSGRDDVEAEVLVLRLVAGYGS